MSSQDEEEVFLSTLYSVITEVEEAMPAVAYKFTSAEDFLKAASIVESQLIYWGEIIQRLHICSATTVLRLKKWYDAMESSFKNANYYGFCSAIRGLIEACADSFCTLGDVIFPIAAGFNHIKVSLSERADSVLLCRAVEDELIHYAFGRKLEKAEKDVVPASHKAKRVIDYLDAFKDPAINELYAELCQVSHPSAMSLLPFLMDMDDRHLAFHKTSIDMDLNKNLLNRHRKAIYDASVYAITTALCCLRLINYFDIPYVENMKTKESAFKCLDGYPLWETIEADIKKSLAS
jgi:hypothetical protein